MRKPIAAAVVVALLAAGGNALAQTDHSGHGTEHGAAPAADDSASTRAYRAANEKMHRGMDIAFTGNADVDFARGMIAHHQGAIDMAKVVLQHGSDPEIRNLAEEVISAQQAEIAWMEDWLRRQGQ
ncbi:MAG: DUF305 domain-containing protein [Kiloniellaceae bacterium]